MISIDNEIQQIASNIVTEMQSMSPDVLKKLIQLIIENNKWIIEDNKYNISLNGDNHEVLTPNSTYISNNTIKINGNSLDVIESPESGLDGQVLTYTNDGVIWKTVSSGGEVEIPDILWEVGEGSGSLISKGRLSYAPGQFSTSVGYRGTTYGIASTSIGQANNTYNKCEFSTGNFAKTTNTGSSFGSEDNTLFTVGNGNNTEATRHNALEIRENGNVYFADTSASGNFYDYPMRKLQDIPSVWKGTWDEYATITKYDDSTLYYIYEESIKTLETE